MLLILAAGLAKSATLKGVVTTSKQEPLVGVAVYITSLGRGTASKSDGRYTFEDLPAGSYTIQYRHIGYITEEKSIKLLNGESVTLNIKMNEDSQILNEVVVSAGRIPEKLSTIPSSISLVNRYELGKLSQATSNLNEMLELKIPGLAPQTGTYSDRGQTLRGRKVLVMVDGIPISTPLRNGQVNMKTVNANDLERIEVIKGATAIYGNGGDGGFINYITKTPEREGTFSSTSNVWGTMSLAKVSDSFGGGIYQSVGGTIKKVSYIGSISYEKTGNQYDAKGIPRLPIYSLGNSNTISGFAKIQYALSDKQKFTLSSNYYKSKQISPFEPVLAKIEVKNQAGDYTLTPGYGIPKRAGYPEAPTGASTLSTMLKYDLTDLFNRSTSLTAELYHQKTRNIFFYSASFENGGQSAINSEKFGIRPYFNTKFSVADITTTLTYGLDLLNDRTNQDLLDGRIWMPDINLYSIAPFLQAGIKVRNTINIKAGIRYDAMRIGINSYSTLKYSPKEDGNFTPSVAVDGGDLNFDRLSANIGIRYIENEKFIPYVNFSQGFSLPDLGRILRSASNADVVRNTLVEAIVTNNYEVGFLTYAGNFKIEAAGYYSTSNIGTGLVFNNERNKYEQLSEPQKVFGGEIEVDAHFLQNRLHAGGSYSWVEGVTNSKTKYTYSFVTGDAISPPKLTGYLAYRIMPKLSSDVNVVYIGSRERFAPVLNKKGVWEYNSGEAPVKDYTVVNLQIAYQATAELHLSLAVNNLLNSYYLPASSQWAAPLRNMSTVADGANMRLSLKYTF